MYRKCSTGEKDLPEPICPNVFRFCAMSCFYGIGQMLINIVIGKTVGKVRSQQWRRSVFWRALFILFGGLADASSVVVGKEIGAGRHMKGYQYVKGFTILCPAITFGICLVGVIFNRPLLSLFGLEQRLWNMKIYAAHLFGGWEPCEPVTTL